MWDAHGFLTRNASTCHVGMRHGWPCLTLAVMSAMLLLRANERYIGALVADMATAARFLDKLAAQASGRNILGMAARALEGTSWACQQKGKGSVATAARRRK